MGLPLQIFNDNLDYLFFSNFLSTSKPFVDAGSGDGRIALFAGIKYSWNSLGIEFDDEFHQIANRNYEKIWDNYSFERFRIRLIRGDFTHDLPYGQAGMRFSDVGTFMNFNNNPHSLVERIQQDSPSGTKFLFYGFNDTYSFEKLKKIVTLKNISVRDEFDKLISTKQEVLFGSNKGLFDENVIYTHLFEKE